MTIITAAEVQKGDLIRVTVTEQCQDRKTIRTHEGVAAQFTFGKWRTPEGWQLFTELDAVIELLDRPKPKINVPTGNGAVVKYVGHNDHGEPLNRTAIRDAHGVWISYDDGGYRTLTTYSDDTFSERMATKADFKVIFEGVKK